VPLRPPLCRPYRAGCRLPGHPRPALRYGLG
jgi:hypothetical protein